MSVWHMQAYKQFSKLPLLCVAFFDNTVPAEQREDGNMGWHDRTVVEFNA